LRTYLLIPGLTQKQHVYPLAYATGKKQSLQVHLVSFWWRVPVLQSFRPVALRTEPTPTEDAPAGATPTAAPATKSHCSAFGRAVGRGQTEGLLAVRLVPRLCLVVNMFRWPTACWCSRLERSAKGIYLGPRASALDELREFHGSLIIA
jgi:hypothetical protein